MRTFDLEAAKRGESIEWHDARVDRWKGCHFVGMTRTNMIVVEDDIGVIWDLPMNSIRMGPKKRTLWVNLYDDSIHRAYWYETRAEADEVAPRNRLGARAYPVEIEE